MQRKKHETLRHELRDCPVPPVKGAVTDLQDLVQKPAGIFGVAHPAEFADKANPAIFDGLQ